MSEQITETAKRCGCRAPQHEPAPIITGPDGRRYGRGRASVTQSLFHPVDGHTLDGYYRVVNGKIQFYNHTGAPVLTDPPTATAATTTAGNSGSCLPPGK